MMRLLLLILSVAVRNTIGEHKAASMYQFGVQDETADIVEDECREEEAAIPSHLCREEDEIECGVCHTMYMKECHIKMELRNRPAKMKMCMLVQGDTDCKEGYRRFCGTRYESECGTQSQYQLIEEDRPVCGVQMVGKCQDTQYQGENDNGSARNCVEVPVMKCQIKKKMVRKRLPNTACRRIPRQFCMKKKCKPKKIKCFYKIQMISELTPMKTCSYSPKRMCQETEDSDKDCRTVKRQVCKPDKDSPPTVRKKICRQLNLVDTRGDV